MPQTNSYILIVSSEFPPQPGGIGSHALQLASHLSQRECDVVVLTDQRSPDGLEESCFDDKLKFKVVRIKKRRLRVVMYLERVSRCFKLSKKAKSVIATGKFSLWNVALSNFFVGTHSIAIVHGSEVNLKSKILRGLTYRSLKTFNTIVAVSEFTKKFIKDLEQKIVVIPNGISSSDWNGTGITDIQIKGYPVLTTVGHVSERKGQLTVIKHLPALLKVYPELHYHCIGIPSAQQAFEREANNLNVARHITFHGALGEDDLKAHLLKTDIFVLLSSETSHGAVEGFGIAVLEANALGVPAIGARGSGVEEAIEHGESGILIDGSNSKAFIEAIDVIMKSKSAFRSKAKLWAESHDWSYIIDKYIQLVK